MSEKKYIDSENLLQWIGERITCEALCGNNMKSDKGCDGNCTLGEITPREKSIISVITESIKTAPAADVEPVVRGEWREMRDPYGDLQGWIHEECGRTTDEACDRCPKCGAHMSMERSGSGE